MGPDDPTLATLGTLYLPLVDVDTLDIGLDVGLDIGLEIDLVGRRQAGSGERGVEKYPTVQEVGRRIASGVATMSTIRFGN